jgi:hypothetical protein
MAALSLLVCVITSAAWVTSHFRNWYCCVRWVRLPTDAGSTAVIRTCSLRLSVGSITVVFARGPMWFPLPTFESDLMSPSVEPSIQTELAQSPRHFFSRLQGNVFVTGKGFGFGRLGYIGTTLTYSGGLSAKDWAILAPDWVIVLLSLPLPAIAYIRRRQRRTREIVGQCIQCGYDLRATPERCPECGTVPPVAVK